MPTFSMDTLAKPAKETAVKKGTLCYHCGSPCLVKGIAKDEKQFCCDGCKLVYEIINENGLCDYYKLQNHPGLSQIKAVRNDKYAYLDNEEIAKKLYSFTDGDTTIVTLYLPAVHCSSCMWLLEHMHKLNPAIIESRVNFTAKEVTIRFSKKKISIRQVVELLTTIGYEPYISLDDAGKKQTKDFNKQRIYKLGIAGFCFGNIMLLSFPEYLAGGSEIEHQYTLLFRIISLVLSIPVFFYSASEFFVTAWKGLQQKVLNIDAPVALAIIITFSRSIYEILSNTGSGYLDSMSGIVFFMLVGRIVQERTYKSISFHRDYKAYFPLAVNVMTKEGVISKSLHDLVEKDVVVLHNDEIIPADSVVLKGDARIDYSFVTGESEPVKVPQEEMVYAGGRQTGEELYIQIVKPVAGSYLTSLWNHYAFAKDKREKNDRNSVIHLLSKYFTWVLFTLAAITAVYWYFTDASKIFPSVTAMLIIACPCALLLAATFTNGNLLRLLSNNGLFLRDATVIEQLGNVNHIIFDKTGTLTKGTNSIATSGHTLSATEKDILYAAVKPSKHPYSKAIAHYLKSNGTASIDNWKEIAGKGIEATANGIEVKVGSAAFTGAGAKDGAQVYFRYGNQITAFDFTPELRDEIQSIFPSLKKDYQLSLLSGDHDKQYAMFRGLLGAKSDLLFEQKPMDKLTYVEGLQMQGKKVLMVGDGLNDAGALQQSNVGITLADDINNFTPSCDAILDANYFGKFPQLLALAKSGKQIINFSFAISILYNIVGLYFSIKGVLSPMIAAILMPASTLSITLITTGVSSLKAKRLGLSLKSKK